MTLMPCGVMLSSLSSGDLGAAGAWTGMVLEKELSLRQKMCSWSGSTCFWPVILCQMQGRNVYTTLNSVAFYFFSFPFILGEDFHNFFPVHKRPDQKLTEMVECKL